MEILNSIPSLIWLLLLVITIVIFTINQNSVRKSLLKKNLELQEEMETAERIRQREFDTAIRKKQQEMEDSSKTSDELMANLREEFEQELQDYKLEQQARIEMIQLESINYAGEIRFETDQRKKLLAKAIVDRAEKFPILLGCLRAMRDQMLNLHLLTTKDKVDPEKAESAPAFTEFDEINKIIDMAIILRRQFEEILNEVRTYVKKSEFQLPREITNFLNDYRRGRAGTIPIIGQKELQYFDALYADDVVDLTADFYGYGKDEKAVKNICWSMITREREFRRSILEKRGFKE